MKNPEYSEAVKSKLVNVWTIGRHLGLTHGNEQHMGFASDIFFRVDEGALCSFSAINSANAFGDLQPLIYDLPEKELYCLIAAVENKIDAAIVESDLAYKVMFANLENSLKEDFDKVQEFYSHSLARKLFTPNSIGQLRLNTLVVDYIVGTAMGNSINSSSFSNQFGAQPLSNLKHLNFPGNYPKAIELLKTIVTAHAWDKLTTVLEEPYSDAFFEWNPHVTGYATHNSHAQFGTDNF